MITRFPPLHNIFRDYSSLRAFSFFSHSGSCNFTGLILPKCLNSRQGVSTHQSACFSLGKPATALRFESNFNNYSTSASQFQVRSNFYFPPAPTRCLSTSPSPAPSLVSHLSKYGVSFLIVDCCTWLTAVSTFFSLFHLGLEMDTVVSYAECAIDVQYFSQLYGVDMSLVASDKAAVSLALIAATITSPIRFMLDMVVLVILTRFGVICGPKKDKKERKDTLDSESV